MRKKQLLMLSALIGIFLIVDGVASIYTQYADDLIFNLGRLLRILVGVGVIWYVFLKKRVSI